jgi:hypothetical protein
MELIFDNNEKQNTNKYLIYAKYLVLRVILIIFVYIQFAFYCAVIAALYYILSNEYIQNTGKEKYCEDISKISKKEITALIGKEDVDVLVGGPPCLGFSLAGKRDNNDNRNNGNNSILIR